MFAREATLPSEAALDSVECNTDAVEVRERALRMRAIAVDNIHKRQAWDKKRYDRNHRELEFEVGDQVKVFIPIRKVGRSEKLLLRWFGPYTVLRKIGDVNYEIQSGKKKDIVHISRMLKYNDPWTADVPIEAKEMPEENEEKEEDVEENEVGENEDEE